MEQLKLLEVAELPQASRRTSFHQPRPPGTQHTHLRVEVVGGYVLGPETIVETCFLWMRNGRRCMGLQVVTMKTSASLKTSVYAYLSRAGRFRSDLCQHRDSDEFPPACDHLFRTEDPSLLDFKPVSSKSLRVTAVIQAFRKGLRAFWQGSAGKFRQIN